MSARISDFGTTSGGVPVQRITLSAGDLTVHLLTLGAVVQGVHLAGVPWNLTPGSDRVEDYEGAMRHHGSVIGPVVNRITAARAPIGGTLHRFEANQGGRNTLHSGSAGTHLKVWRIEAAGDDSATLSLDLPAGEGGFPGNRRVTARFTLAAPATLRMEVEATTDAPTLMNFANHSYWNLDGTPRWDGHVLQVLADRYLPTTPDFTPTGEVHAVAGTDIDFRQPRAISPGAPWLDNCFCLSDARGPVREALVLRGTSGVTLHVATSEPGIQVYDGRDAIRPGHDPHEGLAIEAQGWPDAPNHAGFPSIEVSPGTVLCQITEWRLSRD